MVWSEGSMRPSLSGAARCAHLSAKHRHVLPSRHNTSSLPAAEHMHLTPRAAWSDICALMHSEGGCPWRGRYSNNGNQNSKCAQLMLWM